MFLRWRRRSRSGLDDGGGGVSERGHRAVKRHGNDERGVGFVLVTCEEDKR